MACRCTCRRSLPRAMRHQVRDKEAGEVVAVWLCPHFHASATLRTAFKLAAQILV